MVSGIFNSSFLVILRWLKPKGNKSGGGQGHIHLIKFFYLGTVGNKKII